MGKSGFLMSVFLCYLMCLWWCLFLTCPFLTGNNDISILKQLRRTKGVHILMQLLHRNPASNFSKSPDTLAAVLWPLLKKQEWDCFPTTSLGTKTWQTLKGGTQQQPTMFIDQPRKWHQSFEAGSCICHGQQTGVGQICKISAGAPEIDRHIDAASLLLTIYVSAFLASMQ